MTTAMKLTLSVRSIEGQIEWYIPLLDMQLVPDIVFPALFVGPYHIPLFSKLESVLNLGGVR